MSYSRCNKCKRWHFDDAQCPRHCYEIECEEHGIQEEVYADYPESAIEHFCEQQDDYCDYWVIKNGGIDKIKIREVGTEKWFYYNVCAESTIQYTATMIHDEEYND